MAEIWEIIGAHYGGPVDILRNPVVAAVETTLTEILQANPRRVKWQIVNLGANRIFVYPATEVSATTGLPVEPDGGVIESDIFDDGEAVFRPVNGIALVAQAAIVVSETVRID